MVHLRLKFFLKIIKHNHNSLVCNKTKIMILKLKENNSFYTQIKINKKNNKKHYFLKNLIIINNNTKELTSF
jgi:hypothetical protein